MLRGGGKSMKNQRPLRKRLLTAAAYTSSTVAGFATRAGGWADSRLGDFVTSKTSALCVIFCCFVNVCV